MIDYHLVVVKKQYLSTKVQKTILWFCHICLQRQLTQQGNTSALCKHMLICNIFLIKDNISISFESQLVFHKSWSLNQVWQYLHLYCISLFDWMWYWLQNYLDFQLRRLKEWTWWILKLIKYSIVLLKSCRSFMYVIQVSCLIYSFTYGCWHFWGVKVAKRYKLLRTSTQIS